MAENSYARLMATSVGCSLAVTAVFVAIAKLCPPMVNDLRRHELIPSIEVAFALMAALLAGLVMTPVAALLVRRARLQLAVPISSAAALLAVLSLAPVVGWLALPSAFAAAVLALAGCRRR